MGNQLDIMNDFALKELRRVYSSFDGWTMSPQRIGNGYDTLVRLERMNGGHKDIVRVLVSFNREITPESIAELKKKEKADDGTLPRYDAAVLVPINSRTAGLPAGMKIYSMNSFEFRGDELSWTKKKVATEGLQHKSTA